MSVRKPKKVSRLKLIKALDQLTSLACRKRDAGVCQHCRKPAVGKNGHCSHVIPKSAGMKLRWELTNVKLLCQYCHLHWWHKNPLEAWEWYCFAFKDRAIWLTENKGMAKYTIEDLESIKRHLEGYLEGTIVLP